MGINTIFARLIGRQHTLTGISGIRFIYLLWCLLTFSNGLSVGQELRPAPLSKGYHKTANSDFPSSALAKRSGSQKIHVLVLRAEFQRDTVATTTGDGLFQMEPIPGIIVDPPPHNREYFEDHMEALRRYYLSVSRGKVDITYEVFPKISDRFYKLPHTMDYYGPAQPEELLDERLSELLHDALIEADKDPEIDFSQYQSFLIFHSGVGSDFVIDEFFNPTPNDIPSVFLDFDHLNRTLGKDIDFFEGIPVDDGSIFIREGLILPETESKQDFEIGLNGIVAHQFGHQLGLPSLFNTSDGRTAIGNFGLMDVGFGNENGLIPSQPCAWSKIFLGWEEPIEIRSGTEIPIFASLSEDPRRIYKIPISKEEYFLLENRQNDFNGDSLIADVSPRGVLLGVDDYDTGIAKAGELTGAGILIWHIDERIISSGLIDNTVNADHRNRGIDLEEADGAQDIGELFEGALPGFILPVNGIPEDFYFKENAVSPSPEFTPTSNPNSNANNRANSQISIFDFSSIDTMMTFSLSIGFSKTGFPQYTGSEFNDISPVYGRLDSEHEGLVAVTALGDIIVVDGITGEPVWGNMELRPDINRLEDTTNTSVMVFAHVSPPVKTSPVLWSVSGEDHSRIAVVDGENTLYIWKLKESELDSEDNLIIQKRIDDEISSEILVTSSAIVMGDTEGRILFFDHNGNSLRQVPSTGSAIVGFAEYNGIASISEDGIVTWMTNNGDILWQKDLNFTAAYPPAVMSSAGSEYYISCSDSAGNLVLLSEAGEIMDGFPRKEAAGYTAPPSLGDIDGDGYLDIVLSSTHRIFAYNFTGSSLDNFPVTLVREDSADIGRAQPLLVDLDADNKMEVITGSHNGTITALDFRGEVVPGFPLSCGQNLSSTPFLKFNEENGVLNIFAGSNDRWLYGWALELPAGAGRIDWGSYLNGGTHSGNSVQITDPLPPDVDRLLDKESVYNYPNPVENSITFFHYKVNQPSKVVITIYDIIGEQIASLTVEDVVPGVENEVEWNTDELGTGVYIVKVEAESPSSGKEHAIIKMAVVR